MTEATEQVKEAKPKAAKKVKITIYSDADGGDKGDVILVHNFNQIQIMRNKEVEIDEKFIDCLKGSMIQTLVKGEDDKMHPVSVPRYSYTLG
jgi:hypothetical protein